MGKSRNLSEIPLFCVNLDPFAIIGPWKIEILIKYLVFEENSARPWQYKKSEIISLKMKSLQFFFSSDFCHLQALDL